MASVISSTSTNSNTATAKAELNSSSIPQQQLSPPATLSQHERHAACVVESTSINNMGIASLTSGNVPASLAMFRRALKPLILQLREEAQDETPSPISTVLPYSIMDTERCLATSCPINNPAGSSTASLHTRPFALVETPMCSDPVEDSKLRFSIVCFNLALVYHLQGMLEQRQTTERLNKARSLYQNIYRLLVERIQSGPSGNAVIDMVFMAMLNNMAQLGQELADPTLSRNTIQRLLNVASRVQTTNYGDLRISQYMEQHSRNFLLNVVADSFAPPTIAAAA